MVRRPMLYLAVALLLLPACTAVLGMDRAELDEDAGGATGPMGTGGAVAVKSNATECKVPPTPACVDCLRGSCADVYDSCLADPACGGLLSDYAFCLGQRCDRSAESCSVPLPRALRECLAPCVESEPAPCARTTLATTCALYCACMTQCPNEAPNVEPCLETCATWDEEVTICRLGHCEWVPGDQLHCRHASGADLTACPTITELPAEERTACLDKQETTWPCTYADDCCSGKCDNGVCL